MQPDDPPPAGRQDDDRLSRFVIVVLRAELPIEDLDSTLQGVAGRLVLPGLARALERAGNAPTGRLVTSVTPPEIRGWEEVSVGNGLRPRFSLTQFWRVDLRDTELEPQRIVRVFAAADEVVTAYAELSVTSFPAPPVDIVDVDLPPIDLPGGGSGGGPVIVTGGGSGGGAVAVHPAAAAVAMPAQDYLHNPATGIGSGALAGRPGGRGESVGVVDVEEGWALDHRELDHYPIELVAGDNRIEQGDIHGRHGTSVLGVLFADDSDGGVVGIVPGLRSLKVASHYRAADGTDLHVADAIAAATCPARKHMEPGDVLVLEVQRDNLPTEVDLADFQAIQTAVGNGIVVVAAAGNGEQSVDAWSVVDPKIGKRRLDREVSRFDSGTIMVGACASANTPMGAAVGHVRDLESNWGRRVDCHAWGEDVGTCTALGYTRNFRNTSAATAIVAGVVAAVQSTRIAAEGKALTSRQMRTELHHEGRGTPQAPSDGIHGDVIGRMPDLAGLVAALAGAAPPP